MFKINKDSNNSQIIWFEEDFIDRDDCNDFEER